MKTIIATLIGILAIGPVYGQVRRTTVQAQTGSYDQRYSHSSGSMLQGAAGADIPRGFSAADPVRQIGAVVYKVPQADPAHGWLEFSGTVLHVDSGGFTIIGCLSGENCIFYVRNFPYVVADGETIGRSQQSQSCFVAKLTGLQSVVIGNNVQTVKVLDYGKAYVPPPPTPEQIAARAKKVEDGKQKALQLNEEQAAKGDPIGLCRMGERYRDGEGVDKDLAKAKDYLQKAADAGDPSAQEELKRLTDAPAPTK